MLKQAVFLVGGMGTRLGEITRATPKPLVEVDGRPFLDYLLDEAARHGFSDIVLLAGHHGDQVIQAYDGRKVHGATVRVLREPSPMGTGGAITFALPHLDETFLLANGDSFFDINLRALPLPEPGGMTMALRRVAEGGRYGNVRFEGGKVLSFHQPAENVSGPINAGIYIMHCGFFDGAPDGAFSLEGVMFPLRAGERRIGGRVVEGWFIDIGVPDDLSRSREEMRRRVTRPAVFFDRDGVLNEEINYLHRAEDVRWMPGAREAVRAANDAGCFVFVVTNQAGVAKGRYPESAVTVLHDWMARELAAVGAHVDAFEYCPHHVDGVVAAYARPCRRRKPEPGMIEDLLRDWPVDKAASLLVGDKDSDIEAAQAAGIPGHLYDGGNLQALVTKFLPPR
ncbi:MAG TPA: HAD-IIIA family hydrolase [Rhizomicrobium sp.]|nr:HAD-IIIA family hydrolase [Rhizomicrobium sp.]